jgi:flagellar basal body-associated protein FliL
VAEEAPAEEPVAEEVAEEAPAEEPVAEEVAEEAPAEPPKAKEPKAEKPKVVEKPPTKLQLKIREKYDIVALKTEKKTLKGQIAVAIEAKDSAKIKELRKRKKEIRRILKKAS